MTDNNEHFLQQQLAAAAAISNQTKQNTSQINYSQLTGIQNLTTTQQLQNVQNVNHSHDPSLELLNATENSPQNEKIGLKQ